MTTKTMSFDRCQTAATLDAKPHCFVAFGGGFLLFLFLFPFSFSFHPHSASSGGTQSAADLSLSKRDVPASIRSLSGWFPH